MKNCPLCNHIVEQYHEVTFKEPYIHNNPFDGIHIYGAFSAPKETICYENDYLHFAFYDHDNNLVQHRLVKLGVENPATKSPSDEYNEQNFEDESSDLDFMNEAYDRMSSEDGDELPF